MLVVGQGFSSIGAVRALEDVALGVIVAAALMGGVAFVAVRMAGWRDPESETEFEEIVRHSERLAREGLAVEPDEGDFLELDPLDDGDFEELVREALDDLPDLLRNALAHVAVVISDGGRRAGAYGLYEGDGATRDDAHDRIVIFRDTLRRDFGHDADLLRDQVDAHRAPRARTPRRLRRARREPARPLRAATRAPTPTMQPTRRPAGDACPGLLRRRPSEVRHDRAAA